MTFWRTQGFCITAIWHLIFLLIGFDLGLELYPHLVKRNPVYEDAQLANLTIIREALTAEQIEDMYGDWPENNASAVDSNWKEIPEEDVPEEIRNLHEDAFHPYSGIFLDIPDGVPVPAGALKVTVQQWDALGRIDTIRVRAADLEGLNIYYIGPLGISWHRWPDVK
jgi:hypothetical protein